jgi:hypothetical protein
MPKYLTPRGFVMYADFRHEDHRGPHRFTVQESSLATERRVWIGSDDDRAHLNETEARAVRVALTEFLEGDNA